MDDNKDIKFANEYLDSWYTSERHESGSPNMEVVIVRLLLLIIRLLLKSSPIILIVYGIISFFN